MKENIPNSNNYIVPRYRTEVIDMELGNDCSKTCGGEKYVEVTHGHPSHFSKLCYSLIPLSHLIDCTIPKSFAYTTNMKGRPISADYLHEKLVTMESPTRTTVPTSSSMSCACHVIQPGPNRVPTLAATA